MRTFLALTFTLLLAAGSAAEELRLATFAIDATPPLGSALCDALVQPAKRVDDPLTCRGVVILGAEWPIVLCGLDWVGIGNSGFDNFRAALAEAAGTTPDRVALHCTHAHDAPGCDFEAEAILKEVGLSGAAFDPKFATNRIESAAKALRESLPKAKPVTHLSTGSAKVEQVASNRRVLGPDGKVKWVRYSSTKDPEARAQPEGTIDPLVRVVTFWNGQEPIAVLSYYATHPQSYYGQGNVSCDFPGLARGLREKEIGGAHLMHFNGAGGNVTAGKYNDGDPANRPVLAQRLAAGMKVAYDDQKRFAIGPADVSWRVVKVKLPAAPYLNEEKLLADIRDDKKPVRDRVIAARRLAWLRRTQKGHETELSCLSLGSARIVHMPGELFVEYQLAAQGMAPKRFVAMAAYGDYGMGYIGTEISYGQGGYETGPASLVAPSVEGILMEGMKKLLAE